MREATWRQIGTDVTGEAQVVDVLERANLNYDVELRPVFLENGIRIPNAKAAVRTRDDHTYGIVSDKYEVVQNRDAFDFINHLSGDITFEKAGETGSGMVYIIGRFPDKNILGDKFTPHIIFRNSFAGNFTIAAAICPLRVVCENQFNFAFKNTANTVNIRHMRSAEARLLEARETLKTSYTYMEELEKMAEGFAVKKMSAVQVDQALEVLFPTKPEAGKKALENIAMAKSRFLSAYNSDDNWNFRGTAWGLVNAYTDYMTHKEIVCKGEPTAARRERKFMRTTMWENMNRVIEAVQAA